MSGVLVVLMLVVAALALSWSRLSSGVVKRLEHSFAEYGFADNRLAENSRTKDRFAKNRGVKTHYVSLGQGPLIVLVHGIPEFWYSWRCQLGPLAEAGFRVVALDQRGFNRSDKPKGAGAYASQRIVEDVAAVIRQEGYKKAHIVGHDTGALVAWLFASTYPEMTAKLAILSVPHPNAFAEELAANPAQHRASEYARKMQRGDLAVRAIMRIGPMGMLRDPAGWPLYALADARTDHHAVAAFYEVNYPRQPYKVDTTLPKVQVPTLVIHGKKDAFLLASGHARNKNWVVAKPTTVVIDAGHFVHQEKPAEVNRLVLEFLRE